MSIRDQVQSGANDEGWAIHTNGILGYRGRVVVLQLTDLRDEILREFHCSRFAVCIQVARRCTVIFVASIIGAG